MAKRRSGIPGVSFSAKRAIGISSAKQRLSRKTGIPTTRSGIQRKAGKAMGCLVSITIVCLLTVSFVLFISAALADELGYQYVKVVTQQGPLNMRETASSKADVVAKIPKDTILAITPIDDIWAKTNYIGIDGFVMTKYLTVIDLSQLRTLATGDTGQDVLMLKQELQELFFIDAEIGLNDVYDSDAESAVKLFQAAHGMLITGAASPEMQAFLTWGSPKNNLPTKIMTVNISSKCSGYNHVGQNWSKYYAINGDSISSGGKVDIILGQSISIYSKVTEKDKTPDVGSAKDDVEITQEYFDNGFTIVQTVGVRENNGQYSGNKAVWTITYSFTP